MTQIPGYGSVSYLMRFPSTKTQNMNPLYTRLAVLALVLVTGLAACAPDATPEGPVEETPATETPSGPENPITLTASGYDGMQVGMTVEALQTKYPMDFEMGEMLEGCGYPNSSSFPAGLEPMVVDGKVARIDVTSPDWGDEFGLGFGSSLEAVVAAYGDRAQVVQMKDMGPNDRTVKVLNPDGTGLVFQSYEGRIQEWRVGTHDAIQSVSGCS